MSYTQPARRTVVEPFDSLNRRVLIAVEVLDPVAQTLVSRGVTITAQGLTGEPIVSWSRRFVWLDEGDRWPTAISVKPYRLPFTDQEIQPPRPPNFPAATASERLVRIILQPTAAYPFDGVTAIRGLLVERPDAGSPPMPEVRVQLAWRDLQSGGWVPALPATPRDPATSKEGEFAAFLRVRPVGSAEPDIDKGFVQARLQFITTDAQPETRATPDDFEFLPPDRAPRGRIPEGRLLPRDVRLGWSDLRPV